MKKFTRSEIAASTAIVALFLVTLGGFAWILSRPGVPPTMELRAMALEPEEEQPALPSQEELNAALLKLEAELAQAVQQKDELLAEQLANPLPPGELLHEYVGEFHATAYCCEEYPHICGGNGITASGTKPQQGVTCAADWSVLPAGTYIYIEDVGVRRVEDTGSAIKGQRLDIAVDTHENALHWKGFGTHRVWVLSWGDGREPGTTVLEQ